MCKICKGNIPGIFYITGQTLQKLSEESVGTKDFDIALRNITKLKYHDLDNIVDIGDYKKYAEFMDGSKKSHVTRYFNKIEIEDNVVKKTPISEDGYKLHEIELNYYRKFGDQAKALCKLLAYNRETKTMTLERIKGTTCQAYIDSKAPEEKVETANALIASFKNAIKTFHNIDRQLLPEDVLRNAIDKEFVHMISHRVEPVLPMIESVIDINGITKIDGQPITKNFGSVLQHVAKWVNWCEVFNAY